MKIIGVEIDWVENYANAPRARVSWDGDVSAAMKNMKYEQKGFNLRAQDGDLISFFAVTDSPRTGGYGNASFDFDLLDGTVLRNCGAWSNNSENINEAFPNHDPVMEVYGSGGVAARAQAVADWLKEHSTEYRIAKVKTYFGVWYHPVRLVDGVPTPKSKDEEILEVL